MNRVDHPDGYQYWVHAFGQEEDGTHEPRPILAEPHYRCDICNDEPVTSLFFVSGAVRITAISSSDDPWALCSVCTDLIANNDWRALLDHVTTRFRNLGAHLFPHSVADIQRIHKQLRRLAVGPPVPLTTGPGSQTPGFEQEPPTPGFPSGPA
ncbi:hypothetical protein KBI5_08910 [Frankia sp. KB5]|nr:hypothetical protein KBI5_08910 [Frankia sp. KB5]